MVNIAGLNYLPQVAQWETQIPRLEDGWWPTGGAVDPAADSGLMNWQAQLLGNRTAFLKSVIDGAGIGLTTGVLVGNLDTLTATGTYRAAAGVIGAPVAGTAFTVEHRAGASTAEATQEAWALGSDRAWGRRKVAGAWLPWREQVAVTDALFGAVFGANGYQLQPSGLILQWGTIATSSSGPVTVTFPIAFPTACRSIVGTAVLNSAIAVESVEIGSLTATTFSVATVYQTTLSNAGLSADSSVRWIAIGN